MPHDYYADIICEHGHNVGFYGTRCVLCDAEMELHKRQLRAAQSYTQQIYRFLNDVPEDRWKDVVVKCELDIEQNPTGT